MSQRVIIRKHELVNYSRSTFFNLRHTFYNQDYYMAFHWHNSIEISYVVKGRKIQHMEGNEIEAFKGTLLLVNSKVSHDIDVRKGLEGIVLLIDRSYIDFIAPQCSNRGFDLELDIHAKEMIIEYLFKLIKADENNDKITSNIIVLKIIDLLVNKLLKPGYYIEEKHDETYELMMSITEYIDYHYPHKILLDDIARMTSYNKTYISTIFKKSMGITIFEYLRNVRMQHILRDLKYTDETIVTIALNNGYANIQVFNQTFKKLYHMTPKEYRNKNKI